MAAPFSIEKMVAICGVLFSAGGIISSISIMYANIDEHKGRIEVLDQRVGDVEKTQVRNEGSIIGMQKDVSYIQQHLDEIGKDVKTLLERERKR